MILLPNAVRIHLATAPVNLRKSFEGLANEVRSVLLGDPVSGHIFLFVNRRRNQLKALMFTRGGFTILHKRLEVGTFRLPPLPTGSSTKVELEAHELAMLLEGLVQTSDRGGARWSRSTSPAAIADGKTEVETQSTACSRRVLTA